MTTPFRIIIPARYESSRLPGKPLLDLGGKPMIQHVYERSIASNAVSVAIATDDERIANAAKKFGAEVCMTSAEHVSGTDRITEAVTKLQYNQDDIIVNVQGDEPLIPADAIVQVAQNLAEYKEATVATLCEPITSTKEFLDPNVVKVIMDKDGYAIYFSRAPIAWDRDTFPLTVEQELITKHFRHRGIYSYRVGFLQKFVTWGACELETTEALEQLRVLWHGEKIHVGISKEKIHQDVNTLEDVEIVRGLLS